MKGTYLKRLTLSCAVLLMLGASTPLPARAAQVFNVKTYGATGNGTTDDSDAILAAAAAANAHPGSELLFPAGNYLIHGIITVKGVEVVGQNATLTTTSTGGLEVSGNNTTVHDMRFATTLPASSGAAGILVTRATEFVIRNNSFTTGTNTGFTDCIVISQSASGKVNANNMQLSSVAISAVSIDNSKDVSAQQNVIGGSGGSNPSAFRPSNCNNLTIDSNRITNLAFGIFSNQTTLDSYTNNIMEQLTNNGIDLNSDKKVRATGNNIQFANNVAVKVTAVGSADISNNFLAGGQTGITLSGGSSGIEIRANRITGVFNAITGGTVNNLSITGNDLEGLTSVINTTNNANLVIANNEISGCNNAGIIVTKCIGQTQIKSNTLERCALSPTLQKAIIFVDCPIGRQIDIFTNTYTGTTKATYFIWCVQPSPPAAVRGNSTNTGLPNRIGS